MSAKRGPIEHGIGRLRRGAGYPRGAQVERAESAARAAERAHRLTIERMKARYEQLKLKRRGEHSGDD